MRRRRDFVTETVRVPLDDALTSSHDAVPASAGPAIPRADTPRDADGAYRIQTGRRTHDASVQRDEVIHYRLLSDDGEPGSRGAGGQRRREAQEHQRR